MITLPSVPSGQYLIVAKIGLVASGGAQPTCTLTIGSDTNRGDMTYNGQSTMTLQITHQFNASTTPTLTCNNPDPFNAGTASAHDIKVALSRVGSATASTG